MNRRNFHINSISAAALTVALVHQHALALTLGDLSNLDASKGLKTALERGALEAVKVLGQPDGFLGNERVKIPLPGILADATKILQAMGQGAGIETLITAMNRGAEASVPLAKDLLVKAVQSMTVMDAKGILTGGDTAVTQFFADKTRTTLAAKFLTVVTRATDKLDIASKYNELAGQAAQFGLVKREDANIQQYVTSKTLDGLYLVISDEERKIRQDPAAYGSAILTKVFGALK